MRRRRLSPRGYLIAIEGIDGAGKTTQAHELARILGIDGWDVVLSKEPTDGKWGKRLRESAKTGRLLPEQELELFILDRQEHVEKLISPALEEGKIVIVDRYYFSTVAYQGARGADVDRIFEIHKAFAPAPDLLILLQVPASVGLKRIGKRGDTPNHFESEANLNLVAKIFDRIDVPNTHRIDGTMRAEDIHAGILEYLYDGPLTSREPKGEGPSAAPWNALAARARR